MIQVKDKHNCCGCGACFQICTHDAIQMKSDNEGFLYPHVDVTICVDCGLCEKVCPYIGEKKGLRGKPVSYACASNEDDLRINSSSGGLFTLIAKYVIEKGGVVFGAKFDNDWMVSHSYIETLSDISIFRRSKYIQSKIGKTYIEARQFLREGKLVLFTGTPCQILGLNKFLRRKFDNLITIDIVCHSIPSPGVWKRYLTELCQSEYKVTYVNFKDKSEGWNNYGLLIKAKDTYNKELIVAKGTHKTNIYMKAFLSNLIARPSCFNCPARNYVSGSDITLADCWGFNSYHPELDDNKGMNLALLNTSKGVSVYKEIEPLFFSLRIPFNEVEEETNHLPLIKSAAKNHYRKHFYSAYQETNDVISLMQKYVEKDIQRKYCIKKIKHFVRLFLPICFLKRILK